MKVLPILLACIVSGAVTENSGEDVRTGVVFNQLAIAELVKQQGYFEDVRNQISTMSASLVSSQSFLLGFLDKASNRIESTANSISTHLDESKNNLETLAGIILEIIIMQKQQQNLTKEMQKAMQDSSRASEEQAAGVMSLLREINAKLDARDSSAMNCQQPEPLDQNREIISTEAEAEEEEEEEEEAAEEVEKEEEEEDAEAVIDTGESCPSPFFSVGSECFYILEKKTNWVKAHRACQVLDLSPLTESSRTWRDEIEVISILPPRRLKRRGRRNPISDLAEPDDIPALQAKLREYEGKLGSHFWIGGHRVDQRWRWLHKASTIDAKHWIGGYPRLRDRNVLMRLNSPPFSSRSGRQRNPAVCELWR